MRPKINLDGQTFDTKLKAEGYVRAKITGLEAQGEIDNSSPHWDFFHELIERHPGYEEKYGPGIKKFLTGRSFKKHIELNLLRQDESRMDISWVTCVSGRPKSVLSNLKMAMRVAVEVQIHSFRDKNLSPDKECEVCKLPLGDRQGIHVDHLVHFETLFKNFSAMQEDFPKEFDDEPKTNRAKFRAADVSYSEKWEKYHFDNAILRLVHVGCNLTRKKAVG